jgi:hypothetical protein
MDYIPPVLVSIDVLVSRRSCREVLYDFRSGAAPFVRDSETWPALPLGIRVAGAPTVLAVFRPSSLPVVDYGHMPPRIQALLQGSLLVAKLVAYLLPGVTRAQHFQVLPEVVPLLLVDPTLDHSDYQTLLVEPDVASLVCDGVFLDFSSECVENTSLRRLAP